MSISTLDGVLAGMQRPREFHKDLTGTMVLARPHSLWLHNGIPCPGAAAADITGTALTSPVAGQLPFTNPGGGSNTYIARFAGHANISGTLLLCDRLWHNAAISGTITTEQTFTSSVQIPARDDNGTNTGDGVYAGVEVLAATTTNTPASVTLKYTNTAGGTSTAVNLVSLAPGVIGDFYPIGLASGDTGIQKAQSLQIAATAWAAGTLGVVLYRVLARLELPVNHAGNAIDCLTGGFNKVYNSSVPFLIFIPSTTTTSNITGHVVYSQG